MPEFVVRPLQAEEYSGIGNFVAQTFARGNARAYEWRLHRWQVRPTAEPGFNYAMHRVGVCDGRVVTHVQVKPYTLYYGTARLRVAGIGSVCTHPQYRRQGYAAAVLNDTVTYMAELGAHLALLNAIPTYFQQFGFNPVWPHYYFEVATHEAAALAQPLRLRSARPQDAPYMAALYERHWSGRVTFARSPEVWMWRVAHERLPYLQVVENGAGRLCGYVAGEDPTMPNVEVVADSPEAACTILAEMGRRYERVGLENVLWFLPPDDAMVSYARQLLTVTLSALYQPHSGWMARLVDMQGLVETLLPELVAQALAFMPDFQPERLIFDCQPHGVDIGLRGNRDSQCHLSHQDFIQVMFGSLRPAALAVRPQSRLHPEGVRLLETLFPPRMAVLACWDWF